MKTLDLSPDVMGVPTLDMIYKCEVDELLSRCGTYINQIIYKKGNQKLHHSVECVLPFYITVYCFNVTSLELTASAFDPCALEILADNCKKIKKLSLRLCWQHEYEEQLTKLFEENKNLEDIELYDLRLLCPSLKKLPEHKMKAITLEVFKIRNDIFSSVSTIQFFFIFSSLCSHN